RADDRRGELARWALETTAMPKRQYNDAAIIAAVARYAKHLHEHDAMRSERAKRGDPGRDLESLNAKASTLFQYLLFNDDEFHDAAERPHELREFKAALKRCAGELHRTERVVL